MSTDPEDPVARSIATLILMSEAQTKELEQAGDAMFSALLRLADRATLQIPKYAREAMGAWAQARGIELPEPELEVRVESESKGQPKFPTPEEEEAWLREAEHTFENWEVNGE